MRGSEAGREEMAGSNAGRAGDAAAAATADAPAGPEGAAPVLPILLEVLTVAMVGALIRVAPAIAIGFPLHDGGMFMETIDDIRAAGTLPAVLSYNGAGIPFDYPPLAFIVAAILPLDAQTIVLYAGPVIAVLTIPAVYLIGLELLPGRRYALMATIFYATVPRSWDWLVSGGGLTRAPGLVLALLAIWQLLTLVRTSNRRNAVAAGVCGGLTALTHPEALLFLAVTGVLLVLTRVRERALLARFAGALGVAFAVALPWLGLLAARGHLLDLLNTGSQALDPIRTLSQILTWRMSDEPAAPIVFALGLLGALALARAGSPFIALWLVVEGGLVARGSGYFACVPLTLAAAVGFYDVVGRGILHLAPGETASSKALRGVYVLTMLWTVVNIALVAALHYPPFDYLPGSAVATMRWLQAETPPDAEVAVVSGEAWPADVYGEFLPYLSRRTSMASVQGYEWLGQATWAKRLEDYLALQDCATADASCVVDWMRAHADGAGPLYAYLPRSATTAALAESIAASPDFKVVRDGDDGLVALLAAAP
jgi:hypothetical protein